MITADDTDGIPFERGSDEAITALIEKIAKRKGFGRLFADGIVPAVLKRWEYFFDLADQYNNEFPYGWAITPRTWDLSPNTGRATWNGFRAMPMPTAVYSAMRTSWVFHQKSAEWR